MHNDSQDKNNTSGRDFFTNLETFFEKSIEFALKEIIEEINQRCSEDSVTSDVKATLKAVEALIHSAIGNKKESLRKLSIARNIARLSGNTIVANRIDGEYGLLLTEQGSFDKGTSIVINASQNLANANFHRSSYNLIDRLVRSLRKRGEIKLAIDSLSKILSHSWPPSVLKEELSLRVLLGETMVISNHTEDGQKEIENALKMARLHGFYEVEFQSLMAFSFAEAGRGNLNDSVKLLSEARSIAVKNRDPFRYASAALALCHIHEQNNDRLSAYAVMVRAVASLRDLFGESVPSGFKPWLEALRERWGEEEYDRIVKEFIKREGKV